jgi:DNA-binding transcriptional MerR regulator
MMSNGLPEVPEKRYFAIGEVSRLCSLKPHVLRYWEQEFTCLQPSKRRGRRYYRRDEVLLVRTIRHLLYEKGFTIQGAKAQLENESLPKNASQKSKDTNVVTQVIGELEDLLQLVS